MTRAEKAHKAALAQLGCAVCMRIHPAHSPAEVQLHHLRTGGWGKPGWDKLIPLCHEHHLGNTGIHGMGTKSFDRFYSENYGFTQRDLLTDALAAINKGAK